MHLVFTCQPYVRQLPVLDRQALLSVAAFAGATRLIDNIEFDPPAGYTPTSDA